MLRVKRLKQIEEEKIMAKFFNENDCGDLVRVCDSRHIQAETEKAILVRVGQTLYGEPITTFYPKRYCQLRENSRGGFDVFVPKWVNRNRQCRVGDFDFTSPMTGFMRYPVDL